MSTMFKFIFSLIQLLDSVSLCDYDFLFVFTRKVYGFGLKICSDFRTLKWENGDVNGLGVPFSQYFSLWLCTTSIEELVFFSLMIKIFFCLSWLDVLSLLVTLSAANNGMAVSDWWNLPVNWGGNPCFQAFYPCRALARGQIFVG